MSETLRCLEVFLRIINVGATSNIVLSYISRSIFPNLNHQIDPTAVEELVNLLTSKPFLSIEISEAEHLSILFKEISKTNFILPNGSLMKYTNNLIEESQKRPLIGSDVVNFSKILTLLSTLQPHVGSGSTLCTSTQLVCSAIRKSCNYSSLPHSIKDQVQWLQEERKRQLGNRTLHDQFCDNRNYGESYRDMSLIPYPGEVLHRPRVSLRSLLQSGYYPSAEVFLDVHFKLLREDMIRPIRDGVSMFWNEDLKFKREMYAYSDVRMLETRCDNRKGILYEVSFLPHGVRDITKIRWDRSKRLIYGTLLCIFPMDSIAGEEVSVHDPLWAVVANKDDNKLVDACRKNKHPNITIQFHNGFEPLFSCEKRYFMLESRKVYFEAYKHTLTVLQNLNPSSLPFQGILLGHNLTADFPQYLNENSSYYIMSEIFPNLGDRRPLNILGKWPSRSPILDESQYRAVKLALSNEVAVIQGPPGTGKTYVGTHVMKVLLKTRQYLNNSSRQYTARYCRDRNNERGLGSGSSSHILCLKPILVITYTNHALDQFLVSLLEFESQIVRIGSRSEDDRIKELLLRKRTDPRCGTLSRDERDDLKDEMINITQYIQYTSRILASIQLTVKDIKRYCTPTQYEGLIKHPNYTISDWYNCVDLLGVHVLHQHQLSPIIQTPTELVPDEVAEEIESIYDVYSDSDNEDAVDFDEDFEAYNSDEEFISKYETGKDYEKLQHTIDTFQCENLWNLSVAQRHTLIDNWNAARREFLSDEMETLQYRYLKLRDILNEHYQQIDYSALRKAAVVGMTTTGAAKYSELISQLRPHIIFIEEAAEVLESHVIASLSEQVQHLILIGDHQQLKPSLAEYSLKKHNLDQSLFERLVKNDFEHVQLICQHRMRPEISQFVKHIYPNLTDHHSVLRFNRVLGVKYNMYFLDHKITENNLDKEGLSKSNSHEAKFIAHFASYLLKQGYSTSEMTILTFYEAQRFNIKDELLKIAKHYNQVRVSTVDKYQGEENKIILFSVVRSNRENNIGHCREDNRVCVALSRAKEGLFIIGNSQCLREGGKRSGLWDKILDSFDSKLGETLPLQCQNHPVIETNVSRAEDFRYVKEGGCQLPCNQLKPCGHKCLLKCHIYSHDELKCEELCERPKECGHLCFRSNGVTRKKCFETCGECNAKVRKALEQCGHEMILKCTESPSHELCREKCKNTLACGHNCEGRCGEDCSQVLCFRPCERKHECGHPCVKEDGNTIRKCHQFCTRCNFRVKKTLEDCGHVLSLPCYVQPLHSICKQPCNKVLACGHACERLCGDDCKICSKPCTKVLPCTHRCANPCNTPCTVRCMVPCEKGKFCGHPCVEKDGETPKPCYEQCDDCNYIIEKEVPNCKHKLKVSCAKEVTSDMCTSPCDKILDCGHRCVAQCNKGCTVDCNTPVLKSLDCGHETILPCYYKIDENYKCTENIDIPLVCGHAMSVNCFKKSQIDLQNLECKQRCNFLLPCGHYCYGSCRSCISGSEHVPCKYKCDRTLICGHECVELCHEGMCAPCIKKCENRCPHGICGHPCGIPCPPCLEKCTWNCMHIECGLSCSEPCKRNPCKFACSKKLPCGHQCIGVCGEPCPSVCRKCDRRNFIFKKKFGNEADEASRFLLLQDCGHIFEIKGFETNVILKVQSGGPVILPLCPHCQVCIRSNLRLDGTIKRILQSINAIKCQIIEEFRMSCVKNCKILQDAIQELPPSLYLQRIEDWLGEIDRKVETFKELKLPNLHTLITLFSRLYSHPPSLYQSDILPKIHSTFLNDKSIQSFLLHDEFHHRHSAQMDISKLSYRVNNCQVLALSYEFREEILPELENSDSTLFESHFKRFLAYLQNPLGKRKDFYEHLTTFKLFLYKLKINYGVAPENASHSIMLLRPAHCHLKGWFFCKLLHPFATKDCKAIHCLKCNQ